MVEHHQPLVDHGKGLDPADAPAGQGPLCRDLEAGGPDRQPGLGPPQKACSYCGYAYGGKCPYTGAPVDENCSANPDGQQRATALAHGHGGKIEKGGALLTLPPSGEHHDRGEGAKVVGRPKWPAWTVLPGQLYQRQDGAGHTRPKHRIPNVLPASLWQDAQCQEPDDEGK